MLANKRVYVELRPMPGALRVEAFTPRMAGRSDNEEGQVCAAIVAKYVPEHQLNDVALSWKHRARLLSELQHNHPEYEWRFIA